MSQESHHNRFAANGSPSSVPPEGLQGLDRIGWQAYFMSVAHLISQRSTCERAHIGAVLVRENNILSTGYNGSPAGLSHCDGPNCLIYKSTHPDGTVEENCMKTIHAEINAIVQAAKNGTMIKDADIYITASPCLNCLKVLINAGIKTIYYDKPYKLQYIAPLLEQSGVKLVQVQFSSGDQMRAAASSSQPSSEAAPGSFNPLKPDQP
ncbi:MAG: dCMP deaminase family protein [Rhizobacter sp.]|nr:dCMP deaminase family protein [Chlorobiales bacterium]